MYRLSSSCG
jgi:hypothetical protein